MTDLASIALQRLANQLLATPARRRPGDIVAALGAVQAQDYAGAKWAIGQRSVGLTDADVEDAFAQGEIVRTHVMRPTWHFVAPSDLRWMLALTAPRVHARSAHRYRELQLNDTVLRRSNAVIAKALHGGKQMTRTELRRILERARIDTTMPQRLPYLLMCAELDGVICSGERRGKQFTYALLDERVPPSASMDRDQALRELTMRYFATRGPATPHDFSWWSGLTIGEAKRGLQAAGTELETVTVDGTTYWSRDSRLLTNTHSPLAHLLPNYDEFFIGFRDRGALGDRIRRGGVRASHETLFGNVIVLDGQLVGGWKRTLTRQAVEVALTPVLPLAKKHRAAIVGAVRRFGEFLQLPASAAWNG